MDILVMSQQQAETWVLAATQPYIMISITDPEAPDAKIKNLSPILRLKFCDTLYNGRMTKKDAKRVFHFINRFYSAEKIVVVHCHSGVSRSAGIAKALALVFNNNPNRYTCLKREGPSPNLWCFNCMLQEYQKHWKYNARVKPFLKGL